LADKSSVKSIVFVSPSGTGKTAIANSLFHLAGTVPDDQKVFPFEPEEIQHKMSLNTEVGLLGFKDSRINVIDTPGSSNFFAETRKSIFVADSAVMIIEANPAIKIHTDTLWGNLDEFRKPRIIFVNKIDDENADFMKSVEDHAKTIGFTPLLMQLPMSVGGKLAGIVDLLSMKSYTYKNFRTAVEGEIPKEMAQTASDLRKKLVESVAECDDALLEKYLDGKEPSADDLVSAMKKGIATMKIFPVLCGSAAKGLGLTNLLDFISASLPAYDRSGTTELSDLSGAKVKRGLSPSEPFAGLVFKSFIDPFSGKVSIMKIISGTLASDGTVLNANRGTKEKYTQVVNLLGKKHIPVNPAVSGDIVAIVKLKDTHTGDTLCDEKNPVKCDFIREERPVMVVSLLPKTKVDDEKIMASLSKLQEEDPSLQVRRDETTKELLFSGAGQLHVDISLEKLRRKFGVNVDVTIPKVPYKETIKTATKMEGKYKKQSGGKGQYGHVWIELSPLPRGKGFEFVDTLFGGSIPKNYVPSVEKGIRETMVAGELAGFPVVDIKVNLYDGSYHEVDSSDMAFKIAGSMAFKKAFEVCHPVILEPVDEIAVYIPDEFTGDIIGDINSRRGRILGVETSGKKQVIKALVPMAELLSYATDLHSITQGRGSFTMSFSHFDEVPAHLREKIIEANKKAKVEKEE